MLTARDHRASIALADHADRRHRQLRAATDPTRLCRAFTAAVVTAGLAEERAEGWRFLTTQMAPARRPSRPMNQSVSVTWKNLGNRWPESRRFLRDPGDVTNIDLGARTETSLEAPYPPSGPLPQAARFTCGHGQTTLHVGTDRELEPDELARINLVMHYAVFLCDCLRPDWRRLFGEPFGRRAVVRTRRWMRDACGHRQIGAVWHKRIGPPARAWRVRSRITDDPL